VVLREGDLLSGKREKEEEYNHNNKINDSGFERNDEEGTHLGRQWGVSLPLLLMMP
jgi:hypothetical protein